VGLPGELAAAEADPAEHAASASPEDIQYFEARIRPLLFKRCYGCHSSQAKTVHGGLRLDTAAGLRKGGDSGPLFVAGDAAASRMIQAVNYPPTGLQMPPTGKLPAEEIAELTRWIERGAPLPVDNTAAEDTSSGPMDVRRGRSFWSFQPVKQIPPPEVRQSDWPRRRIDRFLLAGMERQGLAPAPQVDRETLIRRVTFDLTGLPPTSGEVDAFLNDSAPDAYELLVERLLASPHYGERWGRHWLDHARYTDVTASWVETRGQAWLYRDWVVRALNEDVPYDQFVKRQIATDLMPETGPEDIPALGFFGLSPVYWKELKLDPEIIKGVVAEEWEERIDAFSRTFLGLTVACARCHDHKFDPVTMQDYYAIAGVFASSRMSDRYPLPETQAAEITKARAEVARLEAQIQKLSKKKKAKTTGGDEATPAAADSDPQQQIAALKEQIEQIRKATPLYDTPVAMALDEASLYVLPNGPDGTKLEYKPGEPRDLPVFIRGNPSNPGKVVSRRFLEVLSPETPEPFTRGSGRLDLAEALFKEGAPLAARVIVNRVWAQHFGKGIVDTPSDFGTQGSPPSHPELLDDLAARFIEAGWSLKWLHREIVLSATYQQSSRHDAAKIAADPNNRWLARMNRRRLDVEAWRDAMLFVSGELDPQIGGPAVELTASNNVRRTLYGKVARRELNDMLRIYDFPDPSGHSPAREPTTTPLQQLFVLNSPFVQDRAASLAKRLRGDGEADPEAQIRHAYRLLFARAATGREVEIGRRFLSAPEDAAAKNGAPFSVSRWTDYAQALLGSNEFLFVD